MTVRGRSGGGCRRNLWSAHKPSSTDKMEVKMPGLVRKSLDSPEETRPFERGTGYVQLVNLEGGAVGRATFLPGWRWSEHVKPIAKTGSCQAAHTGLLCLWSDEGRHG